MSVIFTASTGAGSTEKTSRFIAPIVRWLIPDIKDSTLRSVQMVVRKGGHVTEYAVLSCLLWRARRRPSRNDSRPWCWSEAGFAFLIAVLFAISDEVHQGFVPGREARVADVCFDASGAALGLLAWRLWGRWRGKW